MSVEVIHHSRTKNYFPYIDQCSKLYFSKCLAECFFDLLEYSSAMITAFQL